MKPEQLQRVIEDADWFSAVAEPVVDCEHWLQVNSWTAAHEASRTDDWDNALNDMGNEGTSMVADYLGDRKFLKKWNEVADSKRQWVIDITNNKVRSACVPEFPKVGIDSLTWIVLGGLLTAEFLNDQSEATPLGHLLTLINSGRYPCGWYGDYPTGQLVVY
ncbi:MAG: hypothetical protein AAF842_07545 [Planctomycetota bacterium]